MKSSAVAQGLRSLTDKLHPQLPLTSRESQRLLTALTASFRRHLDEVHPGGSNDNVGKHRILTRESQANIGNMYSSAAYADRHLASVLTSPLFAKPTLNQPPRYDFESAKASLLQSAHEDPILLLEQYDKQGAATIAIAELCLDTLKRSLNGLSVTDRMRKINVVQPGRRVFLWLLRHQYYESSTFLDNVRMIESLCYFLVHEGRENAVWDWLRLDLLSEDAQETSSLASEAKQKLHKFRWRGKVIKALIKVKLGDFDSANGGITTKSVHSAIDAFFAAYEMRQTAPSGHHLRWFPLVSAAWTLRHGLVSRFPDRANLDIHRYNKFMDLLPALFSNTITSQSYTAGLQLRHPINPSTDLASRVIVDLLSSTPSKEGQKILRAIRDDPSNPRTCYWYTFLVSAAHCLTVDGHISDVKWLKSRIREEFPVQAISLESDLRAEHSLDSQSHAKTMNHRKSSKTVEALHNGVLLPSFG